MPTKGPCIGSRVDPSHIKLVNIFKRIHSVANDKKKYLSQHITGENTKFHSLFTHSIEVVFQNKSYYQISCNENYRFQGWREELSGRILDLL